MTSTHSTPLLQRADDTLRAIPRPRGKTVLVHADLWAGNMMWDGDASVTLIDWKDSGVGEAGIDLGHLRMKMAVQYGLNAATHILDGWEREADREAADVSYWDVVAAVHTPTELDDWEPGFDDEGNRLPSAAITERRDAFLRNALNQLGRDIACLRRLDADSHD
jgi:aminoglycoside phosphotransferase (APT) family kinase protein